MEGRLLAAQVVRVPVLLLLLRDAARPIEMHREAQGIGPWLNAIVGVVVQPLAMAWLGIEAVSAFHQLREARVSASSEAG